MGVHPTVHRPAVRRHARPDHGRVTAIAADTRNVKFAGARPPNNSGTARRPHPRQRAIADWVAEDALRFGFMTPASPTGTPTEPPKEFPTGLPTGLPTEFRKAPLTGPSSRRR